MYFKKPAKTGKAVIFLALMALVMSVLLAACGDELAATPAVTTAASTTAVATTAATSAAITTAAQTTATTAAPTTAQATTAAPTTAAAATSPAAQTINIDLLNNKFNPAEITIPVGSTVIWTNKEARKHTVSADDGSFDSGTMEQGVTFSRKFDQPTTIGYYCKFHGSPGQGMAAKIIVTGTPAVANATTAAAATEAPAVQPIGTISFKDNVASSDQLVMNITSLPAAPAGKAFYGWLVNSANGSFTGLGQLKPDAKGALSLKYSDPKTINLVSAYDRVIITNEAANSAPKAPSATIAYSGQISALPLLHIRHLLVAFPGTPGNVGLEIGLRTQVTAVFDHAKFLNDAYTAGDFKAVKLHAEHLVNIIEGKNGPDFGDLDKDGKVTNPGDGFGLFKNGEQLGYLDGSKQHAQLAAAADDASDNVKQQAESVAITVDNVTVWADKVRQDALQIVKMPDLKSTEALVREILPLANQSLNGISVGGQIQPITGSGGTLNSYQQAQLMADISLLPGGAPLKGATPPAQATTAAAVAAQTTAAANASGNAKEVKIDISQFKFGSGPITIKAGTKVTWVNLDSAPHTATADSGSWDSGILQKGQSFSFTFEKPGLVKYYCSLHGGPGGAGMASTITVEPVA